MGILLSGQKNWRFLPANIKAYHPQAKLLIRYFNDLNIGDITLIQLKEYLARSNENLKPSSLARRFRFMKSFFRWLHEEGHILKNPAAKIKKPKVGKRNGYPTNAHHHLLPWCAWLPIGFFRNKWNHLFDWKQRRQKNRMVLIWKATGHWSLVKQRTAILTIPSVGRMFDSSIEHERCSNDDKKNEQHYD